METVIVPLDQKHLLAIFYEKILPKLQAVKNLSAVNWNAH